MDVLLISATDIKGGRGDVRDRMLPSLVESGRALGNNRMTLALLLQNCAVESLPAFSV